MVCCELAGFLAHRLLLVAGDLLEGLEDNHDEGGHSDGVLAQPGEGRKC